MCISKLTSSQRDRLAPSPLAAFRAFTACWAVQATQQIGLPLTGKHHMQQGSASHPWAPADMCRPYQLKLCLQLAVAGPQSTSIWCRFRAHRLTSSSSDSSASASPVNHLTARGTMLSLICSLHPGVAKLRDPAATLDVVLRQASAD